MGPNVRQSFHVLWCSSCGGACSCSGSPSTGFVPNGQLLWELTRPYCGLSKCDAKLENPESDRTPQISLPCPYFCPSPELMSAPHAMMKMSAALLHTQPWSGAAIPCPQHVRVSLVLTCSLAGPRHMF